MNRSLSLKQCLELNSFIAMQTIGHSICAIVLHYHGSIWIQKNAKQFDVKCLKFMHAMLICRVS